MKDILGGVCAPIGFSANGIHAGMRKNKSKKDLSLIVSEELLSVTQVMRIHVIQMVLSLQMKYVL